MSLTETTRYAVLGVVLREGPVHGYAVREEIRRWGFGDDSLPTESRVYRALDWLVAEELVVERDQAVIDLRRTAAAVVAVGDSAVRRAVLTRREVVATDAGAQQFDAWLRSPLAGEADLAWRIGAARAEDLPLLRDLVLNAWVELMSRVQEHPITDVGALLNRPVEWPTSRATLLSILRAKTEMGQAQVLREVAQVLDGMTERPSRG